MSILDDWTANIKLGSDVLKFNNLPSLVSIVAYACDKECDEDAATWFVDFVDKNNTYNMNQRENYIFMRELLDKYLDCTSGKLDKGVA